MGIVTHARASELLRYEPETGEFYWLRDRRGPAKVGSRAGSIDSLGYRVISLDGKSYKAARVAFLLMTGRWPAEFIDHRDGNPSNNAWANLREATPFQNACNKRKQCRSTTGFKGVYPHHNGQFRVRVRVGGRLLHIGVFPTKEVAAAEYARAAQRLHGEFAQWAN